MKKALAAALIAAISLPAAAHGPLPVNAEVYFSPNGGALAAILREIGHARHEILIQAYAFTDRDIAKALVAAHKKGVKVEVLLDKRNEVENNKSDILQRAGVPCFTDGKHHTAHNKVTIIDGKTVITGSYNFNPRAETVNSENLLVIRSREFADLYRANWMHHREHCPPLVRRR